MDVYKISARTTRENISDLQKFELNNFREESDYVGEKEFDNEQEAKEHLISVAKKYYDREEYSNILDNELAKIKALGMLQIGKVWARIELIEKEAPIKYSKEEFEGYTHRFKIAFETGEPHTTSIDIYSNSGDVNELKKMINDNKGEKVLSYEIAGKCTKEQDDASSKFIEEWLNELENGTM